MAGLVLSPVMNIGVDAGPVESCAAVVAVPGFRGKLSFLEMIVYRYVLTRPGNSGSLSADSVKP